MLCNQLVIIDKIFQLSTFRHNIFKLIHILTWMEHNVKWSWIHNRKYPIKSHEVFYERKCMYIHKFTKKQIIILIDFRNIVRFIKLNSNYKHICNTICTSCNGGRTVTARVDLGVSCIIFYRSEFRQSVCCGMLVHVR